MFLLRYQQTSSHVICHDLFCLSGSDAINEEIPQDTMDKLIKLPYFAKAYDENGMTPEEFNDHTALKTTHDQFSKATQKMVDFCKARL